MVQTEDPIVTIQPPENEFVAQATRRLRMALSSLMSAEEQEIPLRNESHQMKLILRRTETGFSLEEKPEHPSRTDQTTWDVLQDKVIATTTQLPNASSMGVAKQKEPYRAEINMMAIESVRLLAVSAERTS